MRDDMAHRAAARAQLRNDQAVSAQWLIAHRLAGMALGLAGVALLVGIEALAGTGGQLPAILACLGAALSYGFAGVFGRRFRLSTRGR